MNQTTMQVNLDVSTKNIRASMAGKVMAIAEPVLCSLLAADSLPTKRAAAGDTQQPKSIAVIPIFGVIEPRGSIWTEYFGGSAADHIGQMFDAAMADASVGAVILHIDSPGGYTQGTPELSAKIYNARGTKPIVALADGMCASAAYWIGTSADELYVTPSGEVGSVGVYAVHTDWSKFNEDMGIKYTYISAGKYKVEGNPDEPLTDEARDYLQASVDENYDQFIADLKRNRKGAKVSPVKGFGDGRMFSASKAVENGMADGVRTFDEVIGRLSKKISGGNRRRALIAKTKLLG